MHKGLPLTCQYLDSLNICYLPAYTNLCRNPFYRWRHLLQEFIIGELYTRGERLAIWVLRMLTGWIHSSQTFTIYMHSQRYYSMWTYLWSDSTWVSSEHKENALFFCRNCFFGQVGTICLVIRWLHLILIVLHWLLGFFLSHVFCKTNVLPQYATTCMLLLLSLFYIIIKSLQLITWYGFLLNHVNARVQRGFCL